MDFLGTAVNASIVTLLLPFYLLFSAVVSLLPDATFGSEVTSSLTTVMYWVWKVNGFFPVGTLVTVVGLTLAFDVASLVVRGFFWVVRTVRGG